MVGVSNAAEPVLFATLIILVAFIPLFTMEGVPGKIFAPMSVTYGFALTGALIYALIFAPVLSSFAASNHIQESATETRLIGFLRRHYESALGSTLHFRKISWIFAALLTGGSHHSV